MGAVPQGLSKSSRASIAVGRARRRALHPHRNFSDLHPCRKRVLSIPAPTMSDPTRLDLTLPPDSAGQRLDQVLAALLPEYSRTRIKDWIEAGHILIDGQRLDRKSTRL